MQKKFLFFGIIVFILLNITNLSYAQTDEKLVILHTASGKIVIEFFPDDAPNHVENFLKLTSSGFYDKTIFHRIIEDFMIQGGDPKTKPGGYTATSEWGTGDPGYTLDAEFNHIKHSRGIVSMARGPDPNSAGSQFFIVHKDSNFLDGEYTVFGRLATQESFETLDKIALLETAPNDIAFNWGDTEILKTEIVGRSEVPNLLNQGAPETMEGIIEPSDLTYTNEELGISFTAPAGWLIQQPEKTDPQIPDIALVGPAISGVNSVISINIADAEGQSMDERIAKTKESLQPSIDSGMLVILSEEKTKINGREAFVIEILTLIQTGEATADVKFKEVLIKTSEKFYAITYNAAEDGFERNIDQYNTLVDSFTILGADTEMNSEGGGCLIATATFGSELSTQVQQLREIRDDGLLKTEAGSAFMESFNQFYYSFSPTIADLERKSPIFKEAVKLGITPLITSLTILNYVEFDSEETILGYGISLILLNVGMYFVAPTIILIRIFKRQ